MTAPAPLERCVGIIRPGVRCHLGQLEGGGYALWLAAGGPPAVVYPEDRYGDAWNNWIGWEQPPLAPRQPDHSSAITVVIVLAVIIAIYVGFHAVRYHDCINNVGIFSWPGVCQHAGG